MTRARQLVLALLAGALGVALTGCPPQYPNCRTDEDCQRVNPREVCVDGQCRQCRDDSQCDRGQQCDNNSCVAIPNWCGDDPSLCPPGMICRDEFCHPCGSDSECGSGEICEDGRCVDGCREDADCPAGQTCIDNRCQYQAQETVAQCGFDGVYFDFDSSAIRSDMRSVVESNAQCIREREMSSVTLEGNCDPRGTTEYNYALGEQRARAVKRVLSGHGVSRGSIRTVSYGEDRASGSGESSWAQDRRVDVSE